MNNLIFLRTRRPKMPAVPLPTSVMKNKARRMTPGSIQTKIRRLASNKKPRVLDLFAGCGGISLGFLSAGFEIQGAVELDSEAAKSHAMNFHRHHSAHAQRVHESPRNILKIDPSALMAEFGLLGRPDSHVDVIVGGPPCQAFARVGRAKLREVAEHPEAFLRDPRGDLYLRYLQYVRELRPLALLMENVPDVLNYGGHNIAEEVCEALEAEGYEPRYTLLNAVFFGVPQMRERMFLVAYRRELCATKWFPKPTHWIELPKGYNGSRQVALQTIKRDLFFADRYFIDPPPANPRNCEPAVTAEAALSDLPTITEHLAGKLPRGTRHFNQLAKYKPSKKLSSFQELMRTWPGFTSPAGIYDHVIRSLPRDYAIFARMKPGDQYPEAHKHAIALFETRLKVLERRHGKKLRRNSKEYTALWKSTVPPYDPGKFPNKWRKMEADKPARTLMAHLGKDSYSHIHYADSQARTISVREAARLQSFPDGFVFQGPMNPAFRQIGNAVPPLMAKTIAEVMLTQIRGSVNVKEQARAQAVDCV
jgi:DNA (cytosine-5)-methyltransferase 1